MIKVSGLTKYYGSKKAIEDISFELEDGKIYGFLGPNGAGKSTTMNIMTGYIGATSGTVEINGYDILDEPEKAKKNITRYSKDNVMKQWTELFNELTHHQ